MVLWPRDETYYRRNKWAGRLYTGQGHPVFDSPVNNACAHYLHNMLYVLGDRTDASASPARVTAELYRANRIETYDTAALRCWTGGGVEIVFVVSHATRDTRGPVFRYEFTGGVVEYAEDGSGDGRIVATLSGSNGNATRIDYGVPPTGADLGKLWATIESLRAGTPTVCGIEAALPQTLVVCAANESTPAVNRFPDAVVRVDGEPGSRRTWVEGLEDVLTACYERDALPGEIGVAWGVAAREVVVPRWDAATSCAPAANPAAAATPLTLAAS
jgi:hypothetical protein